MSITEYSKHIPGNYAIDKWESPVVYVNEHIWGNYAIDMYPSSWLPAVNMDDFGVLRMHVTLTPSQG